MRFAINRFMTFMTGLAARSVCALFFAATCWAGTPAAGEVAEATPDTPDEVKILIKQIEEIARDEKVPGMGIVLAVDGRILVQTGIGLADVARKAPVTSKTLFRIGDIAQSFIALAALRLQEQGKLKITDTLGHWAPEFSFENRWEATDPVRLVHLLEHTSGLEDMSLMEYTHKVDHRVSLKDALELNRNARRARWRPGSRAAYSSVGPALVAYVIEKATGQPFEDYVTQTFFLPMQMHSATYFEPTGDFAGQHGEGEAALPYWNDMYRASGALNASIEDMAQYLLLLINRGKIGDTQIIAPESIARLERPETLAMVALGVNIAPGLGMLNTVENNVHFRGHYGLVNGGISDLLYIPESGSGAIVMMNSINTPARDRVLMLLQAYLAKTVKRPAVPKAAHLESDLIDHYAGYYLESSPSSERMSFIRDFTGLMHVTFFKDEMFARNFVAGYEERWEAYSGQTFWRAGGDPEPMLAMFREQDGDIVMQSKWGTLRRVSAFRALAPPVIGVASIALMLLSIVVGLAIAARRLVRRRASGFRLIWLPPMIASVLFFAIARIAMSATNIESLWGPWGAPTIQSMTALVVGLTFLLFSVGGVASAYYHRHAAINRFVYWQSALASIACLIVASYLLYEKVIGVPTWWQ